MRFLCRIMIDFTRHILPNGLRVLLHRDETTPLVTVNLMYQVGSRDEQNERTGFAHLFEHLMFGGTQQYPDYDCIVDEMCGESNAFTNCDYTNYYLTVPSEHLRQALVLEADRMFHFFDETAENIADKGRLASVLDVQKKVVTEEYHQRYLNQPYGDKWMLLRPLCYTQSSYRWSTIGADIRHVQEASLNDVKDFFNRYYRPENALLSIAGNIDIASTIAMVEEVFKSSNNNSPRQISHPHPASLEPEQTESRRLEVEREVPSNAICKAWVMCDRWSTDYYVYDIISDLLSNGHSSRMYRHLVQEQKLFSEINAYITGDLGQGLFVIDGKLCDGVSFAQAEASIETELQALRETLVDPHELQKVKNKFENTFIYSQYKAADRALSLCYFEMLGMTNLINQEPECYHRVTPDDVQRIARSMDAQHSSTLIINRKVQ